MTFGEILSSYLSQYQISIVGLSKETGISRSMLGRMKSGHKEPAPDSELVARLAEGIAAFAEQYGDSKTDSDTIKEALNKSLSEREIFDMKFIVNNLNILIASLDFRVSDLSRHLNFDASYLSLIRSGKRSPSDVASFCAGVADFISAHCENNIPLLSSVLECGRDDIMTRSGRKDTVYKWLTKHAPQEDHSALHFLKKLDAFDLNEYINALQFDEGGVSPNASALPTQKDYYAPKGFMQAELTWLQAVIASPDAGRALFYSDMPIEELSRNADFSKQWMMGVALLLKKGIHLDMIHQIDRKESEMMLGLEAWIPLYMTGQVSPYYLKNNQNPYFHHFLRVSDSVVLSGEAINGFYDNGRYHLSYGRKETAYYRERGANLLSKAQPLMDIYRSGDSSKYHAFMESRAGGFGAAYRNILSAPPIYTIPPKLLLDILEENNAPARDVAQITAYADKYRRWVGRRFVTLSLRMNYLRSPKAIS